MTTPFQTKVIHVLKKQRGLADGDYRELLQARYQVVSSRDLSQHQAADLIDALGGGNNAPSSTRAAGPQAPVLQALWLAGWNLGVVRAKDDAALLAFVKRQTGLEHTRFLTEPLAAKRAIEGLKGWLSREAGVVWPTSGVGDTLASKRAVLQALAARLVATGGFLPFAPHVDPTGWPHDFEAYGYRRGLPPSFTTYDGPAFDKMANWLGARLRATLAANRDDRGCK